MKNINLVGIFIKNFIIPIVIVKESNNLFNLYLEVSFII